ncbi:lysophospholipase, partial [Phenoliferia sp. Uapishka_3]
MLASLLPFALALAPAAIASYAPSTATCPETLLQDNGSPLDGTQKLATREANYITNRRTNVLPTLWADYLADTSARMGYDTSVALQPRVSIAVSGGGYRAALFGAGTLSAFDSRNATTVAPLLQLADYISGLSGGSWMVTSLAMNNLPDLWSLVLGSNDQTGWKADHGIISPGNVLEDAAYYVALETDLKEKELTGAPTSLVDTWGRALSYHFFNGTTDDNFYDDIAHDNGLQFSSIQYTTNFDSTSMPFPIVVTTSRVNISDQTDADSPWTTIPPGNTQFEFTPYTFGSFDPTLAAHVPIENAGTLLNNGALPDGTTLCTVGYENAGFVIGSSAALFNGIADISDLDTVFADYENLVSVFEATSQTEDSVPLVANWPNSFQNYVRPFATLFVTTSVDVPIQNLQVPSTGVAFESAGNEILELTDGGEDNENIPLGPLLVKARAQDLILAVDASADVAEPGGFIQTLLEGQTSIDGGWPAGVSLIATQNRTSNFLHGYYDFPSVPTTLEEFTTLGFTTRPTFFGCNTTGNGDTSVIGNYPIIVYLPNAPVDGYNTNTSTILLEYSDADQLSFLTAAQTNAVRGYELTGSADHDWNLALKCAIFDRARKRAGLSRTSICEVQFDRYCYADGVVEKEGCCQLGAKVEVTRKGPVGGKHLAFILAYLAGLKKLHLFWGGALMPGSHLEALKAERVELMKQVISERSEYNEHLRKRTEKAREELEAMIAEVKKADRRLEAAREEVRQLKLKLANSKLAPDTATSHRSGVDAAYMMDKNGLFFQMMGLSESKMRELTVILGV